VKCGARIAMGVAGGYFLGRTKKMKLALMLGGWAAGRELGGPGQIIGQAGKMLGENPQVAELTDQVRGRLLEAGKGAAMAVVTRQVEALTDRMSHRVEDLGGVGQVADLGRDFGDADLGAVSRNGEPDDDELDELDEQYELDDQEQDEEPVPRTRRARASETASSRSSNEMRSSSGSRSSGGSGSSGRRSSPGRPKAAARSSTGRGKSETPIKAVKRGSTPSARTPKKTTAARKASRTTRTRREG
jgi:uncharacterized membrane protein YgcG